MTIQDIARVCHEANRAYCKTFGDHSHPYWDKATPEMQRDIISGVLHRLDNPDINADTMHALWLESMTKHGWKFGEKHDLEAKTHPVMRPYAELPPELRAKDALFLGVVDALQPLLTATSGNIAVLPPAQAQVAAAKEGSPQ